MRFQTALVVDDNAVTRTIVAGLLQQAGIPAVSVCEDGALAFRMMQDHSFDLMVVDLHMAPIGGLELIRLVRQRPPGDDGLGMAILAMSGDERSFAQDLAMEAGADRFLRKPVVKLSLEAALAALEEGTAR